MSILYLCKRESKILRFFCDSLILLILWRKVVSKIKEKMYLTSDNISIVSLESDKVLLINMPSKSPHTLALIDLPHLERGIGRSRYELIRIFTTSELDIRHSLLMTTKQRHGFLRISNIIIVHIMISRTE